MPPYMAESLQDSEDPAVRQIALASLGNEYRTARRLLSTQPLSVSLMGQIAGKERYVYDMSGASDPLPGKLLRREGDRPADDEAANEAYDYSGDVYDFYKDVFDRDSLDDAGLPLRSSIHAGDTFGGPMSNAFFNGQQMAYGDGDGSLFTRFTQALDVVGHELTHGVVSFTSNLDYFGESGALNESFADVMGSLILQWKYSQTVEQADWYIGKDVLGPGASIQGVRTLTGEKAYINDPHFGTDPQPKHYQDRYTGSRDRGGVHINSGIPNHAFYLAAMTIGGYAWEKTGKIWYITLKSGLSATATFEEAATATIAIAEQVYGNESEEQNAVRSAWQQVGVI
ncbi:MAG: M4 family metallopeptidase [Stenomitos rutilans HA7619-LM2]|nr:M4 family metallopeptidase [Stenomitos rutilans HA7619-LM2]